MRGVAVGTASQGGTSDPTKRENGMKTMRRLRFLAATTAAASLVVFSAGGALAAGTLDQQQTNTSWASSEYVFGGPIAQTFTAGLTGQLDTISVNGASEDVTNAAQARPAVLGTTLVQIAATSGGMPVAPILASEVVTLADGWNTIALSSPVDVVAGTQYAIVLAPQYLNQWRGTCSNLYGGGQALAFYGGLVGTPPLSFVDLEGTWMTIPDWVNEIGFANLFDYCVLDFAFRTYVTNPNATPPPTSSAAPTDRDGSAPAGLLLGGLAGLLAGVAAISIRRWRPATER
jgi:hypothetical protein